MRSAALWFVTASLVLLGIANVLPGARASSTVTLAVEAYGPNEGYHFEFNDNSTPNPAFDLHAGDHVVVHLHVDDGANVSHNFHVDSPVNLETPCCSSANQSATMTFDVPAGASGTILYYCSVHRSLGMEGVFHILTAKTQSAPTGIPGFEAVAAVGGALVAGAIAFAGRARR
jgi:plastocyanin